MLVVQRCRSLVVIVYRMIGCSCFDYVVINWVKIPAEFDVQLVKDGGITIPTKDGSSAGSV
jgi:hypothetical protein